MIKIRDKDGAVETSVQAADLDRYLMAGWVEVKEIDDPTPDNPDETPADTEPEQTNEVSNDPTPDNAEADRENPSPRARGKRR